jgi:exonuclease III
MALPAPAPAPAFGLLIMSYNCAAWMKTIKELPDGPGGRAAVWFERHGLDIVCVQEAKVNAERVALDHMTGGLLCTETGEYESFWAPSRDPASKGRQGCTTWARKGLTLSADAAPLGAPEVDMQGRCIVTEHRAFLLFNVYGPRRGKGVAERLKFWDLLRRAMRARRLSSGGKPVVLCGDLNIRTSVLDTSALELRVPENPFAVSCLCGLCGAGGRCQVLEQLRVAWPSVLVRAGTSPARLKATAATSAAERSSRRCSASWASRGATPSWSSAFLSSSILGRPSP